MLLLGEMGITVFNNDQSGTDTGEEGSCSGRDISGSGNGTMTLHDIFDMYSYLAIRGFSPDHLVMHPLAWKMFMIDPEVREIIMNGAVLSTRSLPNGGPNKNWPTGHGGYGHRSVCHHCDTHGAR